MDLSTIDRFISRVTVELEKKIMPRFASPVIPGAEYRESMFRKGNFGDVDIPVILHNCGMTFRLEFTDEEREWINNGADLFVTNYPNGAVKTSVYNKGSETKLLLKSLSIQE